MNAVALGLYLAELRLPGPLIGLILSGALLGTMLLTLVVALRGDRIGRRRLLVAGALLMLLALLIPFVRGEPWVLALIGLSGMVAVAGNETTGLQSVDQAAIPQTVDAPRRTAAFAAYNLVAQGAAALGALSVGPMIALGETLGFDGADRYATCFTVYAATGLVAAVLALRLDARVETGQRLEGRLAIGRSRRVVASLSVLYGLDSFASGLAVQSFIAFWFASQFGASPGDVGVLFAVSQLLAAASFPVAAWLAARIGLINTMVFTHIPSSLFLIAMPVAPSFFLAAALFLARSALASMDVPARQSYTMAVVAPEERTATAGVTNLAKSIAQTVGPVAAGTLLVPLGIGVPLVACGLIKIGYDLALFASFRRRPPPEEAA